MLAYVVDVDGNPTTTTDTDLYLKIQSATKSEIKTIRFSYNNVPDTAPKFVKTSDNQVYLFWIQNESMIKMLSVNEIILKAISDDHANSGVKAGDININTLDKILMGDKISNVSPFVDDNNNLYIAWQQNSNNNTVTQGNSEIEFKQDLYVAGLVSNVDASGNVTKTWSNPVRFTNNGKVSDLPTAISLANNKLLLVNNQYNLKSSGDSYVITISNLQEIKYKPASSLEIAGVSTSIDSTDSDGSVRYKLLITAQNTGLFAADGFSYNGNITYDGAPLASSWFNGSSADKVLPGDITTIGGPTSGHGETPVTTPEIFFTLTREQQHHLDKVKLHLNIIENNIADAGITSNMDVFDVCERFNIITHDEFKGNHNTNENLKVKQIENGFEINGILTNSGNVDSFGNEKIYVINQNDWDHPVASTDYINLPIGQQMKFTIPINIDVLNDERFGIKDLVLVVKNDDGKKLSSYETVTLNASVPYDFVVNGVTDRLTVEEGKSLVLDTTYRPSDRYKNASIYYSVSNGSVAKTVDNVLFGLTPGTTKLKLTTKEFGGRDEIEVVVTPKTDPPAPAPTPGPSGGGGSRGGGGGGGGLKGAGAMDNGSLSPVITEISNIKMVTPALNEKDVAWVYDPVANKFKLNITTNGESVPAKNVFVTLNETVITNADGIKMIKEMQNTYYFDDKGFAVTGWIHTPDNKWYFFENSKTMGEGRMVTGWKQIGDDWYYFAADGYMLVNTYTPDGYKVGADGKFVK